MSPKTNPTNKYNELLSQALEDHGYTVLAATRGVFAKLRRGDVLHVHWLDSLYHRRSAAGTAFAGTVTLLAFHFLRLRGVHLVWTIHNLYPHHVDHGRLEKILRRRLAHVFADCIVASVSIEAEALGEFGLKPAKVHVIHHGSYVGAYPTTGNDMRQRYGLTSEEFVYLFVGSIKPYKGLDRLISDFSRLDIPDAKLLIVGKPSAEMGALPIGDPARQNIVWDPRYVPDDELGDVLAVANVVVLPFQDITTSGSAILALSARKPLVTPRSGFVEEYFPEGLAYTYDPGDHDALVRAMRDARRGAGDDLSSLYSEVLRSLSWQEIARKTANVYDGRSRGIF
jgi:glycosyltransferase involved in cell wall biosynthesis